MKIRKITNKDFNKLTKLWKEVHLNIDSIKREKKETELLLKYNQETCFVIEKNNKIVGSILGAFNGKRAWIHHLAIHPNDQKKGYGTLLINKIEKKLIKKGATKILLGVNLKNLRVASFYEKLGFEVMNDSITMVKDLWKEKKI